MVNAFSQCLLSMAVFSTVSFPLGGPVVSYALFATGMTTVVLSDTFGGESSSPVHGLVSGVVVFVIQGVGFLGEFSPSVLLVLPVSITVVLSVKHVSSRNIKDRDKLQTASKPADDPLENLLISLPSSVLILAFLVFS